MILYLRVLLFLSFVGFVFCDADDRVRCRPKSSLMLWYNGKQNVTVNDNSCQRWDSQTPHNHSFEAKDFSQSENLMYPDLDAVGGASDLASHHDYCRNPDKSRSGPWCFTTNSNIRREPCFRQCILDTTLFCLPETGWPYTFNTFCEKSSFDLHICENSILSDFLWQPEVIGADGRVMSTIHGAIFPNMAQPVYRQFHETLGFCDLQPRPSWLLDDSGFDNWSPLDEGPYKFVESTPENRGWSVGHCWQPMDDGKGKGIFNSSVCDAGGGPEYLSGLKKNGRWLINGHNENDLNEALIQIVNSFDEAPVTPCFYRCADGMIRCLDTDQLKTFDYKGPKTTSISGKPCTTWANAARNTNIGNVWLGNFMLPLFFGNAKILYVSASRRCMNFPKLAAQFDFEKRYDSLGLMSRGPFCFVPVNDTFVPEQCFPTCDELSADENNCTEKNKLKTLDYKGARNYSLTGKPCVKWNLCTEVKSKRDYKMKMLKMLRTENYCRNIRNAPFPSTYPVPPEGPWCFTYCHKDELNHTRVEMEPCFKVCDKEPVKPENGTEKFDENPCDLAEFEHECSKGPEPETTTKAPTTAGIPVTQTPVESSTAIGPGREYKSVVWVTICLSVFVGLCTLGVIFVCVLTAVQNRKRKAKLV